MAPRPDAGRRPEGDPGTLTHRSALQPKQLFAEGLQRGGRQRGRRDFWQVGEIPPRVALSFKKGCVFDSIARCGQSPSGSWAAKSCAKFSCSLNEAAQFSIRLIDGRWLTGVRSES